MNIVQLLLRGRVLVNGKNVYLQSPKLVTAAVTVTGLPEKVSMITHHLSVLLSLVAARRPQLCRIYPLAFIHTHGAVPPS